MITAEEARAISRRDGSLDEQRVNELVKDIMTRAETAITTEAKKGQYFSCVPSGTIRRTNDDAPNVFAAFSIASEKLHELGYAIALRDEFDMAGWCGLTMDILWAILE